MSTRVALPCLLLVLSLTVTAAAHADVYSQMLDYWTLDEGGGLIAHDMAKHYNGTLENFQFDNTDGWRPGQIGRSCLQLDGVNDCVSLGSRYVLPDYASISAWVKVLPPAATVQDVLPPRQPFYILSDISASSSTTTYIDTDGSVCLSDRDVFSKTSLHVTELRTPAGVVNPDGKWHNIVFLRSGWTQAIFVDGVRKAVGATSLVANIGQAGQGYIGMGYQWNPLSEMPIAPHYADGYIDDVRVYSRLLATTSTAMGAAAGGDIAQLTAFAPLAGDANDDGRVNFSDYLLLEQSFNGTPDLAVGDADFTGDGAVDFSDYLALEQNFNTSSIAAPEPASLALLTMGTLAFIRRR